MLEAAAQHPSISTPWNKVSTGPLPYQREGPIAGLHKNSLRLPQHFASTHFIPLGGLEEGTDRMMFLTTR